MSDLDKLIAMADKVYKDIFNVARRERGLIRHLADVLESVRAERDAALARIAEAAELHYRDTPSVGGDWCLEDHREWPCPTAVALGLNEGENNE